MNHYFLWLCYSSTACISDCMCLLYIAMSVRVGRQVDGCCEINDCIVMGAYCILFIHAIPDL